jgi:hypothetical protein
MELLINIPAILVAVLLNFILGFVWFTLLFGQLWGREMGYDPTVKAETSVMVKGMLFMLIGNFLFAWVFAHNIAAWTFVPDVKEMSPAANAISAAVFTWLGFYVPGHLGSTVWEKKSWTLFAINAGYNLVSLLVVAFILCYWR